MFNITSKYFSFFNNKPPASWVTHITRDFLTCYSCSNHSSMVSGTLWFSSHSIKIICKSKYRNLKMWNIHTERKGVTNIFKNKICLENLISRSFSWNFGINSNVMLCYCRDTRHKIRSFFRTLASSGSCKNSLVTET